MNTNNNTFHKSRVGAAMKIWSVSNFLYRHKFKLLGKIVYYLNYILFGCVIPPNIKIGKNCHIAHSIGVVINHNTIIGNNVVIMHNVTLGNYGVSIGDNVFLGTGCVIQGPCKIGNGARIGANTYVNFDVPDNSTVVGTKGRILTK